MITMSSGHSIKVPGASKYISEVSEARRVVERTKFIVDVIKPFSLDIYHEEKATNQKDNLSNIINYHNSKNSDYNISIHFNSATFNGKDHTQDPKGIEIYYTSQKGKEIAEKYLNKLVKVTGLKNRGVKKGNLQFLNKTTKPSILIEICFVNSTKDVEIYKSKFEDICIALAELITNKTYTQNLPKEGVYQVVTQSYRIRENALKYQQELKSKGIDTFLQYKEV